MSLASLVTLECILHLQVVAVVGCQETGTDEQENNMGAVEVLIYVSSPISTRENGTVMPGGKQALSMSMEQAQVEFSLFT